ncbi:MAG: response regulator [Elusimicrobiota bacterium]|jgi:DNA-binding response OmpR family regulator
MAHKILVVDDEVNILTILKDSLEFSGFFVVTAQDGMEALDMVEKENPELLVLDVGMPKLDGWEVCRRLKGDPKTKDIPIIILTAYAQSSDQRKGLQLGADSFIAKPCDFTYLVEQINALLANRKAKP